MIAEDDSLIRLDLRTLLESNQLDVCAEACDGEEAVALAAEAKPDVIVMDVRMPRLDGIDAAERILEHRSVPIVLLTGYGQDDLIERAVDAGVFAFLTKPFEEANLISALHTARARHSEFAELQLQTRSLFEALEARKVIERAKGILMAKEGISEDEAFARLRRASQNSGRPMKLIAEALAATLG
jgi:response regulator NasT